MGRFLGEGTCFLFDSEPIDLPDNRILCRTSRDYCRTIGLLSYKSDPYSRICNPAAYKTCCLQCRQIANLPERLAGTIDRND